MDTLAYLKRIDYRGSLAPTAETLRQLQVAHLLTVPFENLSIHAAEPIVLDDEALFDKIVRRRRGGFCYELNGLFAALLRDLGFEVARLSAGVANSEGVFGPDFDHMTLLVVPTADEHPERWLADVGFGDSFLEPLRLDSRDEQVQGAISLEVGTGRRLNERGYKIIGEESHLVMMERKGTDELKPQYRFTLQSHDYPDYAEMCRYHQTSPQSHFTKARLCSRATPQGRVTLSGMRLVTTVDGQERIERTLTDDAEYASILFEHFGVEM